jgi:hypothetical protein
MGGRNPAAGFDRGGTVLDYPATMAVDVGPER